MMKQAFERLELRRMMAVDGVPVAYRDPSTGVFGGGASRFAIDDLVGIQLRDLNDDLIPDAIAWRGSPPETTILSVYLGDGRGGYQDPIQAAVGQAIDAIEIGDWNQDGQTDLILENRTKGMAFLASDGKGAFQPVRIFSSMIGDVVIAKDPSFDLVVANPVRLYQSHATQGFVQVGTLTDAEGLYAAGDYDNDGRIDILGYAETSPVLYANQGNGTLTKSTVFESHQRLLQFPNNFTAAELDGDAGMEFIGLRLTAADEYAGAIDIIDTPLLLEIPSFSRKLTVADIDGDGKAEFGDNAGRMYELVGNLAVSKFRPNIVIEGAIAGQNLFRQLRATVAYEDVNGDGSRDQVYTVTNIPGNYYTSASQQTKPDAGTFIVVVPGAAGGTFGAPVYNELLTPLVGRTRAEFSSLVRDVDGDADLDLVFSDGNGLVTVFNGQVGGDLNRDGRLTAGDIDALCSQFGKADARFDLNHDNVTNGLDVDVLVNDIMGTRSGDLDLDGRVDFDDFLQLSQSFGQEGSWRDGDLDCNGIIETADFLLLSSNFGFAKKVR